MKIWKCGSSPRSGSRNAWTRIKNVKDASPLNNFEISSVRSIWFPVSIGDHGRKWSGGVPANPAPKNSEFKNPLERFSPRFFGIKTASSSLIIFQRAKLSTPSITHLYWCNWMSFLRKNVAGSQEGCLVLALQYPVSQNTCNPEETGPLGLPIFWSHTLFSRSGPVGLPPVPWTEKNNWNVVTFRPFAEFIAAVETWLDRKPSEFFWVACES